MESNKSKLTDPIQNIFSDIKKILEFIEIKDMHEALKYETEESRNDASMWMNAKLGMDTYITYHSYWTINMFQEIIPNSKLKDIKYWMSNPYDVPTNFRENLLIKGREAFLNRYEEKNEYYRMLNGLPPIGTKESDFIYLTEPMRNQLHTSDVPVHMLSTLIQNRYMCTDEYKNVVNENPDKKYLKYIGSCKIDTFTARNAKDFDIIRYALNRSDINPNIINIFASLYADYREYVMTTLYNENLEGLYANYRPFMGSIIMMFTLMQLANKSVEAVNNKKFLDDSVLHIILSMYGIPNTLLLTKETRRDLVVNMLKLIREKGTDEVYYDLIKILGYQDIVISKLMLMKGQTFDKDNNFKAEENIDPYFVQINLQDDNPYDTISSGKAPVYPYHSIIDNDPTWWDLPDTQEVLKNSNYSIADSKYIVVEATIHQMKYLFESIYFTKLILDNKTSTDLFMIDIPEIFGVEQVSVYDLMIYIIAAMCMNNGLSGDIISDEDELLATAGFNFDMNFDLFEEFINTTKYVDKERVMDFIKNLTIKDSRDITRLFNEVLYPMREWLENKIVNSDNKYEYVEYESIYRALYTYDISNNSLINDFKIPLDIICEKYNISDDDILAYKHFYPRTITGEKITLETFMESRYKNPFLNRSNNVEWWIHIIIETPYGEDDRGYLYFHDILNCDNLMELTNPDGTRIFMDWEDGEVGWELNKKAVERAIYLIDQLDENELHKAYFQVDTPVLNSGGKVYKEGELLPSIIRTGLYKDILKEKITMDMNGMAVPPKTYKEYLCRKNKKLYELLTSGDRFNLDKDSWINDLMKIVFAVEDSLDLHLKYFEQAVAGSELFFKPLITLMNHFKSAYVNFAKTGLKYVFGDKIDAGGNSNMFKLFDEVKFIVHFVTLANKGFESQFGLYDTINGMKYHLLMKDKVKLYQSQGDSYIDYNERIAMGALGFIDEVRFFKNGDPLDNIPWIHDDCNDMDDEYDTSDDDTNEWKKYIKSYASM